MRRPRFYDWKRADFIMLVLATVLIAVSGLLAMGLADQVFNIANDIPLPITASLEGH
jgi:hypothetical protein